MQVNKTNCWSQTNVIGVTLFGMLPYFVNIYCSQFDLSSYSKFAFPLMRFVLLILRLLQLTITRSHAKASQSGLDLN